jgi:nitrile hydratase subunit beta
VNGPHDMGGMQCYGPVNPERDEPLFHAGWERRALAVTVAMGATGLWNIDMMRSERESLPPATYLKSSYYEIWIRALEAMLARRGIAVPGRQASGEPVTPLRVPDGEGMRATLARGAPTEHEAALPARFQPGDFVHTRNINPQGHTRLPRYARGKPGVIEAVNGCHVFADANAAGRGEDPQWLYTVRFAAMDLFGEDADPAHFVFIDCFEPYLEN